jgi:Tol biopolymer transport system component
MAVSPDGTAVVLAEFVQYTICGAGTHLVFHDLRTGSARDVTAVHCWRLDTDPAFSPEGATVVFSRIGRPPGGCEECQFEIWSVPAGGGAERQLTTRGPFPATSRRLGSTYGDRQPSFSPDHKRIVFARNTGPEGPEGLYTMAADGTDVRLLFKDPQVCGFGADPTWSPDGTHIAFLRNDPGSAATNLFVMRADGTDVRALTTTIRTHRPENPELRCYAADGGGHWSSHNIMPAWTPDSTRIVFATNRNHLDESRMSLDLYSVQVSGGAAQRLVGHPPGDLRDATLKYVYPDAKYPSY